MLLVAADFSTNFAAIGTLLAGLIAAGIGIARFRPDADVALVGAATGFVGELRLELQNCRDRIATLERKEERREEEMRHLVDQLGQVEHERDALARRVLDQETTIREQATRIDELEAQVEDLKRRGGVS